MDIVKMHKELLKIFGKHKIKYIKIIDESILRIVYELFIFENFVDIDAMSMYPETYFYVAIYFEINKKSEKMLEYYLKAIANNTCNNIRAIKRLTLYYKKIKDYVNMIKYFKMAVELLDIDAMIFLADYYAKNHDNENALFYYKMAIDRNSVIAMGNLAYYYEKQRDYENMIKYLLMAYMNGDPDTECHINQYFYQNIDIYSYSQLTVKFQFETGVIDKYNKILSQIDMLQLTEICVLFECVNCLKSVICAFKQCGHSFCLDCYDKKCRICFHDDETCTKIDCSLCAGN